ncbi:MAG: hypothetical protein ACD_2C00050G0009 [uncultured bacterium (gcode 4)]|uniref:Uncharacterized protein n=1 Tax=uncultured bacterium (gcode 4) TaxID=1234023 RepID=K2GHY1_9BACT|nr:MAG: hypothetical protein ACD_2C00050G0009 [uncultured bacterium (gcode 4)]
MRKQYQYILVWLSLIILYILYLIFSFKYIDIQKDISIDDIGKDIWRRKITIESKKDYLSYINTLAYKDKTAKSSQNKKNPWEEVVFIVTKDELEQYKKLDVQGQMNTDNRDVKWPTYWMSNWQKWIYYILKDDIRD